MQRFKSSCTVHFNECDPAGILFFGNIFTLAHQSFEDFLNQNPETYHEYFASRQFAFPLIKAEAQFQRPMCLGKTYQIQLEITEIRNSSFQVLIQFLQAQETCAVVNTVHVCIDKLTQKKSDLPLSLRSFLESTP